MSSKRKNYLPTLLLALVLWGLLAAMVAWVDPELIKDILLPNSYLPFFLIFFPASFLTVSLLAGNSLRGFLLSAGLTGFLVLRAFQLGNLLNLLLILGIIVAIDRYFQR